MGYVEVAVELPVQGTFHYATPAFLAGRSLIGCRVLVPFGGRTVTGVVVGAAEAAAVDPGRVRDIHALVDPEPQISPELVSLCLWVADYYEAPPGEALRAALPVGSRIATAQLVELTDAGRRAVAGEGGALTRAGRELLGALAAAGKPVSRPKLLRGRTRAADLDALAAAGLIAYAATARRARVREKTERVARLVREPTGADHDALARAPARAAVLGALAAAGGEAAVADLRASHPRAAAHLRALADGGWVELTARVVRDRRGRGARNPAAGMEAPAEPPVLNPAQAEALAAIRAGLAAGRFAPVLLHGITGSGKTEIYLQAIADVVAAGRTAVVLVPEISLTPQLAARFRARFGDRVAVLHSGLGERERFDEWQRLRAGDARIALGARSAVFAPVRDIGIIVVDEEHDASFKQEEGVRYHARAVALVRAQRADAVCVLGSATPSLESFAAAEAGRYRLLTLPERATHRPLPEVELIDLRRYRPDPESMLTAPLAERVAGVLARGEQAILFLNRRGFSTFVVCVACGHAFRCVRCSVSLTYHRGRDRLCCHYCGHAERLPGTCPACGTDGAIARRGLGTEKVAAAVADKFPAARVARLDRDVAAGSRAEAVLARVARREVDILVGTQMVSKGHDFPGVTLVGVLLADTGLSLPDFRAAERTFQLLTQVAGRAGRGAAAGHVLIQSYRADETAIAAARRHDYHRFYRAEMEARRELGYPPSGHLIALRIDGPDATEVEAQARALARRGVAARGALGDAGAGVTLLGPAEAPLARLKGRTRWHIWLRGPARSPLRRLARHMVADAGEARGVRITVDVDPISAL